MSSRVYLKIKISLFVIFLLKRIIRYNQFIKIIVIIAKLKLLRIKTNPLIPYNDIKDIVNSITSKSLLTVRCLEKSSLLFVVLAWAGYHPIIRIGIKTPPFSAHAWVELDGNPLLEPLGNSNIVQSIEHVG